MRVLITGGFGFVGGRVAQHMQVAGHQVLLGSRTPRKTPNWLPDAEIVKTDWSDCRALEQACIGVDAVVHAAGMNARDCAEDPIAALEINGLSTARLVGAASKVGVKRFIYLSTAHVYASPLLGIISEDTCPRNLHPYATSHLAGENAVLAFRQRRQIESVVLRLSNAYGAPVHEKVNCWMLLVNDLCRQAVETGKLVLNSGGSQQRDFICMTEVCRVVEYLSLDDHFDLFPNVLNVGSGVSQTVLDIAHLIQRRCQWVLGIEPELVCPTGTTHGLPETLEYRSDKLKILGFVMHANTNDEIDCLLGFCRTSFDQARGGPA